MHRLYAKFMQFLHTYTILQTVVSKIIKHFVLTNMHYFSLNNDLLLRVGFAAASGLHSRACFVALAILFDGCTSFWSRIE